MQCSRYSFGPNRLHYCGPDANKELQELIEKDGDNFGLSHLLKQFKTLFPYLRHISKSNNIQDPFDKKVVEAYWLGNEFLDNVGKSKLYDFLISDLKVKDKLKSREFNWLEEKIGKGAVPHHSFHVLNIWDQGGHGDHIESLERMGECLISSGEVISVNGPQIVVSSQPLIYTAGKLALGVAAQRSLTRQLEAEYDIEQIKPGQIVSIHWSQPCEIITPQQAATLRKYTLQNIAFANLNI